MKKTQSYQYRSLDDEIGPQRKITNIALEIENKYITHNPTHEEDNDLPDDDRPGFIVLKEIIPAGNMKPPEPNENIQSIQYHPRSSDEQDQFKPELIHDRGWAE